MTKNNENRPGYKKTKVGWIPEEWKIRKIQEMAYFDKNSLPSNTPDDFKFNYITLGDLEKGKLSESLSVETFVNAPSRARRIVNDDDVLLATVRPNLQGFGIIHKSDNFIASTGFAVLTMKNDSDAEFTYQYLYSEHIQKQLFALLVGSNYPAINSSDVKKLKLLFPPLAEQKKIAEILSTWDSAIEKTEKLIEKCELRKKGLLNQLVVNSDQLSWNSVQIGRVAKEISVKNKDCSNCIVLSCTKHQGLVSSLEYFGRQIYSKDLSTYKIVSKGQFAYATNHIEEGSIGYQNLHEKALISPMYTVFETNGYIDDSYLYELLKSDSYVQIYRSRISASVDRRGSLRWKEFSQIKIPLPSIEEQKKIAIILDTADKEISRLKSNLEALKVQKKGLMQKLLTGEVRVTTD
ncbi:MAG: restriction endonuclease subunit S [Syntrophaceae bacterium]|nr:restriction endonuclease subunit S [Syntrophaceae bacterium]